MNDGPCWSDMMNSRFLGSISGSISRFLRITSLVFFREG
jgi:hypothetical protein